MTRLFRVLIGKLFPRPTSRRVRRARARFIPVLNGLEERATPATFTHTSLFTGDATGTLVATVSDDKPGYEGKLFWNYHFTNATMDDPYYNPGSGPIEIWIAFNQLLDETPLDQGTSNLTYTEKGTVVGPGGAVWNNGYKFHGVPAGESADFWFTTSTAVKVVPATAWADSPFIGGLGMTMSAATIGPKSLPRVSIGPWADPSEAGGDVASATGTAGSFVLSRTGDPSEPLTVSVSFDSSTPNATEGADYTSVHSVTFDAGSNTAFLTVTPKKDNLVEAGGEVVHATLNAPGGDYVLGQSQADLTIADDPPVVSVLGWSAADEEGESSDTVTAGYFVLHRTGGNLSAALTVSVSYDGSGPFADEGFDFVGDQSVTFDPNSNTALADVTPIKDNWFEEDNELVHMTIDPDEDSYLVDGEETASDAGGTGDDYDGDADYNEDGAYGDWDGEWGDDVPAGPNVMIVADDPPRVVEVAVKDVAEGLVTGSFVLRKEGGKPGASVVVRIELSGTATPGVDYDPPGDPDPSSGDPLRHRLVTVPAGSAGVTLTIDAVLDEDEDEASLEPDETVILTAKPVTVVANGLNLVTSLLIYNIYQVRPSPKVKESGDPTILPGGIDPSTLYVPSTPNWGQDPLYNPYMSPQALGNYGKKDNPPGVTGYIVGAQSIIKRVVDRGVLGKPRKVSVTENRDPTTGAVVSYTATMEASLPAPIFTCELNLSPGKSWVYRSTTEVGNDPNKLAIYRALAIHEDIHYQIGMYIVARAKQMWKYKPQATATAAGKGEARAVALASDQAKIDLLQKWAEFEAAVDWVLDRVNVIYDCDTEHALNAEAQRDWVINWRKYCDEYIKDNLSGYGT